MTTTINNEHEKNQGRKVLNVPNKREQNQTCLDSAEREGLRPKGNVPILRFPEFRGEWEKMRLDGFTERVMRKNRNNLSKLPLTISAQYGLVDQVTFFNKVIASTDMSNYYLLKKGEFAYNKSYSSDYPWGAIKRLDRYDQGALSSLYICFALQDSVVSDYILQYFESSKWHKGVSEIAVEGVRNHGLLNVSVQDFFHTYHFVPKEKEEQIKIGKFLALLDERIATQSKVIEDLKKLKCAISKYLIWSSGLLEEKIPISKVGSLKNGYAFQSSSYDYAGNYAVVTIANVTGERYISSTEYNHVIAKPNDIQVHQELKVNDILISLTGNVGRVSLCRSGKYLLNQRVGLLQLHSDVNREFVYQVLSSRHFEQSMISCSQGAAQMNIGKGDIENYMMPYSCKPQNLNIISSMLKVYDARILVEYKMLQLFNRQKAYLLASLFI